MKKELRETIEINLKTIEFVRILGAPERFKIMSMCHTPEGVRIVLNTCIISEEFE